MLLSDPRSSPHPRPGRLFLRLHTVRRDEGLEQGSSLFLRRRQPESSAVGTVAGRSGCRLPLCVELARLSPHEVAADAGVALEDDVVQLLSAVRLHEQVGPPLRVHSRRYPASFPAHGGAQPGELIGVQPRPHVLLRLSPSGLDRRIRLRTLLLDPGRRLLFALEGSIAYRQRKRLLFVAAQRHLDDGVVLASWGLAVETGEEGLDAFGVLASRSLRRRLEHLLLRPEVQDGLRNSVGEGAPSVGRRSPHHARLGVTRARASGERGMEDLDGRGRARGGRDGEHGCRCGGGGRSGGIAGARGRTLSKEVLGCSDPLEKKADALLLNYTYTHTHKHTYTPAHTLVQKKRSLRFSFLRAVGVVRPE